MKKNREEISSDAVLDVRTALGRFVGAYLGAFGLAAVYVAAVARGVSAPSALLRAGLAYLVFLVVGRILGAYVGRMIDRPRKPKGATTGREAEAMS